jgi:hypothetical protein
MHRFFVQYQPFDSILSNISTKSGKYEKNAVNLQRMYRPQQRKTDMMQTKKKD